MLMRPEATTLDIHGAKAPYKQKTSTKRTAIWRNRCPTSMYGRYIPISAVIMIIFRYIWTSWTENARIWNPKLDTMPLRMDRVPQIWKEDEFECLGWRATNDCNPNGLRAPQEDKPCDHGIIEGMSGYCEIRNRTTGEIYHVMASTCRSVIGGVVYTCNMAQEFTDFSILAAQSMNPPPLVSNTTSLPSRGILLSIYDQSVPGVIAIIQMLRFYGCKLPVELFYRTGELNPTRNILIDGLLSRDKLISLREITEGGITGFGTKPYALFHSSFDQVLFLDSDNIPLRDPTYLFDIDAFKEHGAIFWPDIWHPMYSVFNVQPQSILWEYLDIDYWYTFEHESAQMLVDRRRAVSALSKLQFYTNGPSNSGTLLSHLNLAWGDKDLYRFAWRNTSTSYHFIDHLPLLAGRYSTWRGFCGLAMVQFDPNGEYLFLHRNMIKLNGNPSQVPMLTHLQRFTGSDKRQFKAECRGKQDGLLCWGIVWPSVPSSIESIDWIPTNILHAAEVRALEYARTAGQMAGMKDAVKVDSQSNGIVPSLCLGVVVILVYVCSRRYRIITSKRRE